MGSRKQYLLNCVSFLAKQVPDISLDGIGPKEVRFNVREFSCRLLISARGHFGLLVSRSFMRRAAAKELVEASSALPGPSRFARHVGGTATLTASWPMALAEHGIFYTVADDLRMLLGLGSGPMRLRPPYKLSADLWKKLRLLIAAEESTFIEVPTSGETVEFKIRDGSRTRQWRYFQPSKNVFTISSLVTNWRADATGSIRAASELLMMLNRQLRWVKLVKNNFTVDAEVSFPVNCRPSERFWSFGKKAVTQAVSLAHDQLRMIQTPEVASVFERLHFENS